MKYRDINVDCIPAEFKSPLPYPEIKVEEPNKEYAKLILEDYAGLVSELTAVLLYMYQSFVTINPEYKEVKEALEGIGIVEMTHLEMLAEIVIKLGANPKYCSVSKGRLKFWNASYVAYYTTLESVLLEALQSEKKAIAQYRKHIQIIKDKNIDDILNRIILDEELHIEIFTNLYNKYVRK